MNEQDALSTFDFNKVTGGGLCVKFQADKPLTLRVLTVNPVVYTETFEDKKTGEVNPTTKFAFVVYNFTEEKAQILQATPNMARKIGSLHIDPDFGANIRKIDIKISPTGEKLERRYDIQVLPNARDLTNEQIEEARAIDLDDKFPNGGRMSIYEPADTPLTDAAEATKPDVVETEMPEKINLDDIPF